MIILGLSSRELTSTLLLHLCWRLCPQLVAPLRWLDHVTLTSSWDSLTDESTAELDARRWGSDGGSMCLWKVHLVPKPLLLFSLLPGSKASSYILLPWYPTYHRSRNTHPRILEPKPLIVNQNQNPLLCADVLSYFVSDRIVTYFAINEFWSNLFTLGERVTYGHLWVRLAMQSRLTLNLWSSCCTLPSARTAGMHNHATLAFLAF